MGEEPPAPPLAQVAVKARSALFLLCTCALFCAISCAPIGPPADGRAILTGLKFEGNDSIKDSELKSKIVTAPSSGIFRKTYRTWDADLFEIDQQRILRWYRERGFFESAIAKVDVLPAGERGNREEVKVWIHVAEGRRTRVTRVDIAGMELLSHDERVAVQKMLPLAGGDWFDEDLYEKDKTELVTQLREHGFAAAESSGEVKVSLDEATAVVTLTAITGARFKFGRVIIAGNRAITKELIERAAQIPTGKEFQQSQLNLAQQRVYNLGVFSGARVGLEPLGDDPVAAVRVDVREAPFQTMRYGLGASLEQNRFVVPRVKIEYTNRNFLGGAHKLELAEQAGYAFVPSITSPDKTGPVSLTTVQFTLPSFLPFGIDFINRAEFSREIQYGFNYYETAARTALQLRYGKQTIVASLNFVHYFGATLDLDLGTLLNNNGTGAALLSNCVPSCTLTYPELRWTLDLRDDLIEPTKGFYATASISHTLKPGSFNYLRFAPEARGYIPFFGVMVLALRAQIGELILDPGENSSPFTQRFFAGGQSSNRGFGALGQGPQVGAQPNTVSGPLGFSSRGYATKAIPIGGNGLSLASAELRIHTDFILTHLSIVPFVDASRVSADAEFPFAKPLEFAPGLGLRYLTAFGPIRLDVAFLANPVDVTTVSPSASVLPTPYSVHCHHDHQTCILESRVQYHLSIGEAF